MKHFFGSILICTLFVTLKVFGQEQVNIVNKLNNISNGLTNHSHDLMDYELPNENESVARDIIVEDINLISFNVQSMLSKLDLFSLITSKKNRIKGKAIIDSDIENAYKLIDFVITETNQKLSSSKNIAILQNGNEVIKLFRDTKEIYGQIQSTFK